MSFYGSNRIQQILGYLKTYLGRKFASKTDLTSHVSKDGDVGVKGHVSIYNGDVSGKTYTSGEAAASAHTHDSRYMLSNEQTKLNNAYALARSLATLEENARASKPYAVGDWLVYGGQLYEVTVAMAALDDFVFSGANQNVNAITMEQIISDIEGADISGKADLTIIAPIFNESTSYSVGDWVIYSGQLYKCSTAHRGEWDSAHFWSRNIKQLMPTNIMELYGEFRARSISNVTPSRVDVSVGGASYSDCYQFNVEYTLTMGVYSWLSAFLRIQYILIIGDNVYRNYQYKDMSAYEAEYQAQAGTLSYPFIFPIIDPDGYIFALKFYNNNLTAGTINFKIEYLNGINKDVSNTYLKIEYIEKA